MKNILAFSGSTRVNSYNTEIVRHAALGAKNAGANATTISLKDFSMPLYDGDLEDEQGIPANAQKLFDLMCTQDAFIIASPEYNSSITPLLKNTIDWVSRVEDGSMRAFEGKSALIIAASPGYYGGIRAHNHLRDILQNIGISVLPESKFITAAYKKIDDSGKLIDEKSIADLEAIGQKLVSSLS